MTGQRIKHMQQLRLQQQSHRRIPRHARLAGTKRHLQRMGRCFRVLDHRTCFPYLDDCHG